jgi:cytochrome P450
MPLTSPINLADPTLYESGEPEVVWSYLRDHHPVYLNRGEATSAFWALTRHAEAASVLRDPTTFVSSGGMRVGAPEASVRAASGRMMIVTDPPRHGKIRGSLAPLFAPRAARMREKRVAAIVEEVVDTMLGRAGVCDFAVDVVALPAYTVCDLLGVPPEDWRRVSALTGAAFGEQEGEGIDGDFEKTAAHIELFDYLDHLVRRRRTAPRDDFVSQLVTARVDGRPLSDDEILLNCEGVINGGIETTRHAAARGMLAFAESKRQWAKLRESPSLLAPAVEEILRWASPPLMVMRHATAPTELAGQAIESGDAVVICNAAVNRDPTVFHDPEAFDISRAPGRHLALGLGPHFCIGAALARIELHALFAALTRRVVDVQLVGPPRHLRSNFIWGLSELQLLLTAS